MTARRPDFTIAAVGILVLGAAAAGAAGRAWHEALTAAAASDRLAYVDVTVALLALGLVALYPLSSIILTLIRPATLHSRRAGDAPVESRISRSPTVQMDIPGHVCWSPFEVLRLRHLIAEGTPRPVAARILGRTQSAVRQACSRYGVTREES